MGKSIDFTSYKDVVSEHTSLSLLMIDYNTTQEKALSEGVHFIGLDEGDLSDCDENNLYLSIGSEDSGLLSVLKVRVSEFSSKGIKLANICYVSTAANHRFMGLATALYQHLSFLCIQNDWILIRGYPGAISDLDGYNRRLSWLNGISDLVVIDPDDAFIFDIAEFDYLHQIGGLNIGDWKLILSNYMTYKSQRNPPEVAAHRSLASANIKC